MWTTSCCSAVLPRVQPAVLNSRFVFWYVAWSWKGQKKKRNGKKSKRDLGGVLHVFCFHEVVDRRQTVKPIRTPFPPRRHVALVCHTRTDAPAFVRWRSTRSRVPGTAYPGHCLLLFCLRRPTICACLPVLRVCPSPAPNTIHESDSLHVTLRYVRICPCASLERFVCFPLYLIPFTVFFLLSVFRAHARCPCAI